MTVQTPDFSGWATKHGIKCTDGRTIMKNAFEHQDGEQVTLVWHHGHDDPENVLGHAILTNRPEGVWCDGYFNESPKAIATKEAVRHKDVTFLSIFANQLMEKSKQVMHGVICEVSLVIKGANPGARIEEVAIRHSDDPTDVTVLDDAAYIYSGEEVLVGGQVAHADSTAEVVNWEDVYETLNDTQKDMVGVMLGAARDSVTSTAAHSGTDPDPENPDEPDDPDAEATAEENKNDKGESTVTDPVVDGPDPAQAAEATPSVTPDVDKDAGTTDVVPGTPADTTDATPDAGADNSTTDGDQPLAHQEGTATMTRNLFEENGTISGGTATATRTRPSLSHDALHSIVANAEKVGFKDAFKDFLEHSQDYGIEDINLLFPDAKSVTSTPEMIQRRMEWVAKVLDGTKHSPFAKVKTLLADITAEQARAKGYTKGNRKTEEVIKLLRRTTSPATIYKKQKLDRDDLLDITDFDVVNWLWAEINMMLQEELARAILVGDGRSSLSEDKIKDPEGALDGTGIRSVLHDDDLYSIKEELPANVAPGDAVKALVRMRSQYRGSGKPTLFISDAYFTDIMLTEDKFGRSLYETEQALADKLRVKEIVAVDLFEEYDNLLGIMVSLQDYTIGSNRGGELTRFDQFDIDFNQYKYLLETRLSGGLTKPFSAIVIRRAAGTMAVATPPSFDGTTDTITIPTATGVTYTINDEPVTGNVVIDSTTEVEAHPNDGYYLESNTTRSWTYTV